MKTSRLEAFTDGVMAIIITIMVLESKVPERTDREARRPWFTPEDLNEVPEPQGGRAPVRTAAQDAPLELSMETLASIVPGATLRFAPGCCRRDLWPTTGSDHGTNSSRRLNNRAVRACLQRRRIRTAGFC